MNYKEKELLRDRYFMVHTFEKANNPKYANLIKSYKEKIRDSLKREEESRFLRAVCLWEDGYWVANPEWSAELVNIFHDKGDGYNLKFKLPPVVKTKEGAEDYYNEFIRKTYIDRGYDCTGQAFSCGHVVFYNANENAFYCYECVALDV